VQRFRLDFLTRPYDEEGLGRVLRAASKRIKVATTHAANFDRILL
jgi:FixJ family two-component response regulator